MVKRLFILVPDEGVWHVGAGGSLTDVAVATDATPAEIAVAVSAEFARHGYGGQGVLLGVPSGWCLAAWISTEDLRRGDRDAMAYRLEEKLPLAAEAVAADFVTAPVGGRALGVCVTIDRVAPLVTALEAAGVVVQSISPLAMLAMQSRVARVAPAKSELVIWEDGGRAELFLLAEGMPVAWSLSAGRDDLELQRALLLAQFGEVERTTVVEQSESIRDTATRMAGAVLSGRVRPWVELRRGALSAGDRLRIYRRAINAALAMAAVFLIALTVSLVYRGWRYERLANSSDAALRADFRREFAGWAEPVSVAATISSERRRLEAAGASALPAEARRSALAVLRQVLSRVPGDRGFTIARATFNDTSVQLEGEANSQADVEPIVEAARSAGLEVPPAQMRKGAAGTWSFVVRGDRPAVATGPSEGRAEP
jgi:hypothetical protein